MFKFYSKSSIIALGAAVLSCFAASDATAQSTANCGDLFFSEYLEGTSNNKAIEIYNPTSTPMNVTGVTIELFSNGASTPSNTFNMVGTIAPGDVYVIRNSSAALTGLISASDTASGVANFNGDDALLLRRGADTLDIIGNIGCDPGTAWENSPVTHSMINKTLIRKSTVQKGVKQDPAGTGTNNTTCPFPTLVSEWDVLNIDDISNLGMHTSTCISTTPSPTLNFAAATSTVAENVAGGTLSIPVTITNPSATTATTVTVAIATSAGTATSPADYTITTGTLTFAAGSSANENAVLTIVNDALIEGNETINLILTSPSAGAVLGTNTTHTVTIQDDDVTAPIVSFQAATATVSEAAGTITIPVTLTNPNANATSVNVVLASPAGSATLGADYTFTTQTLTFPANSTTTQNATLTIINDQIVDKNETIILALASPTNGATIIGNATHTITITDNDLPLYTVAQVTTNHPTTFVADSLNVMARLTGVLYGHNQRPAGLTFALVDNTGGINLFKSTCTPATCPATPLVQGDSVMVYGKIEQFNGLTQMAVDSIQFIAGNKTLKAPVNVTVLDETTESELVRIAGPLTIVDATKWTNAGSGFTVQVTDGTNTYDMRIDADSDIFGTPAPGPTQSFSLVGIGGQFDSSSPYSSGYQILPRDLNDIQLITGIKEDKLATSVSVYPNPVRNEVTVAMGEVKGATDMYIINTLGQVVSATSVTNATTTVNVSNLPAGVYIIRLVQANKTAVKQFVKIN